MPSVVTLLHLLQKHAVSCSMDALETHELLDYCRITVLGIRCLGATKLGSRPDAEQGFAREMHQRIQGGLGQWIARARKARSADHGICLHGVA